MSEIGLIIQIKINTPLGIDNPCTSDCDLCDKKTGVCLRKPSRFDLDLCDPPCEDDEECVDGECVWWNKYNNVCNPPCPLGVQCINGKCETNLMPYCPVSCRIGQVCIDGRCGCYKGMLLRTFQTIFVHF